MGYPKKTKNGKEYYEGKLEGSEDKLMAFLGVSKKGSKYLSLLAFENNPEHMSSNSHETKKEGNKEEIVDPMELPF